MLGWFHRLMPRDERFFDLFKQHSDAVLGGALALRAMLEGGNSVQQHIQEVMDREHQADNAAREILLAVRRTFITPFDRGNIKDLITSMDNSIDQMQKTAKGVMTFDVREFTTQQKQMGDHIVECAKLVQEAMPLLSSISAQATRLASLTEKISRIEGQADELHDTGLKALYELRGKTDPMAFFVGNEIYDHLEKVVDRFDDVANEIHGIVIEYV